MIFVVGLLKRDTLPSAWARCSEGASCIFLEAGACGEATPKRLKPREPATFWRPDCRFHRPQPMCLWRSRVSDQVWLVEHRTGGVLLPPLPPPPRTRKSSVSGGFRASVRWSEPGWSRRRRDTPPCQAPAQPTKRLAGGALLLSILLPDYPPTY